MSASSTCRRLSLLTGSSVLAGLLMAGAGGVALAPTAAFAANECGDPTANGTSNDTFQCTGSHAAITYTATSGNLTLQLMNNVTATTGGLVVTPTGTNSVTISRTFDNPAASGDPSLTSTSTTTAALEITRATGGTINVNLTDNDDTDAPMTVSGVSAGIRLRNAGTSSTTLQTANGPVTASAGAGIELGSTGTGSVTLTNNATVTGSTAGVQITGGNNATVTNNIVGVLNDELLFANTGSTTFTNNGRWNALGASNLRNIATSSGSATLTNTISGVIATNLDGGATTIDFGVGGSTFANAGRPAAGQGTDAASTLTLAGLAAWNNSGLVLFGSDTSAFFSDGAANDRVVMTRAGGGTFTGSGDSRFVMDVDFGAGQSDCSAAATADCLDLRGQNTAGTTLIEVNTVGLGVGSERIVLVDASGAGTDAATFTLSAESSTYRDVDGGLLDGGLFLYALEHDTAAKQHVLEAVSIDGEVFELSLIARQASEPWRTATGMWHDRQADLRGSIVDRAEGYAPGAWLKIAGGFIDESRFDTLAVGADTLEFETSYTQKTTAVVGGIDLLRFFGEDSAWVLGVTAGSSTSTADFADVRSLVDIEGVSFGGYASMVAGPMFVDAIVAATDLDLTHSGFGGEFESAAKSFGYQLEGGYRLFRIGEEGPWAEPLASLTYVKTQVDDLEMGEVTTSFEDSSSLRGALGLRLGGDLVMDTFTASFSATGRVWKEFDGESASVLSADFGDTALLDEGMDNLGDLGVAVSLFTMDGRLSAHLAYNLQFQEDYQNTGASFGVRYNW